MKPRDGSSSILKPGIALGVVSHEQSENLRDILYRRIDSTQECGIQRFWEYQLAQQPKKATKVPCLREHVQVEQWYSKYGVIGKG